MEKLSEDLLLLFMSFLSISDLIVLALVSKEFYSLFLSNLF